MDSIRETQPDVLAVQEATEWVTWDGARIGWPLAIAQGCGFSDRSFFAPNVTLERDSSTAKAPMVDAILHDMQNWSHGQALFSRSGFVQLSNVLRAGHPRAAPVYKATYEGYRDTEPRELVVARIANDPIYPFVVSTHWTTLQNERGTTADQPTQALAQEIRTMEAELMCHVLNAEPLLANVVILMGDFNAVATEPSMQVLQDAGFELLAGVGPTHPDVPAAIDHILIRPRSRLEGYRCWSIDGVGSDHSAVVADVSLTD